MHIVKSSTRFQKSVSPAHRDSSSVPASRSEADKAHEHRTEPKNKTGFGHTMADVEKQILDWQEEMKQDNESLKVLSQSPISRRE